MLKSVGDYAFYGVYIKNFMHNSTRTNWDKVTVSANGNERLSFTVCADDTASIVSLSDAILIFNNTRETLYISGTGYCSDYTESAPMVPSDIELKVKHIVLDKTIAGFGAYTFANLTNLETVTGGSNMRYLGIWAFKGLSKLTKVEFTNAGSLGVIGYGAFTDYLSLNNVKLSNSLIVLGGATFRNCASLTSITVPAKIQGDGDNTFNGCASLKTVNIQGAKAIRQNAFTNCTALGTVTLPEGLTTIDKRAFSSANISKLNVPSTLTLVGDYAFYWTTLGTVTGDISNVTFGIKTAG